VGGERKIVSNPLKQSPTGDRDTNPSYSRSFPGSLC
jgi:hypothetical protein